METLRDLDVVRAASSAVRLHRADPPTQNDTDTETGTGGDATSAGSGLPVMVVRFSPFDTWYEIDSVFEGRFLERTAPGAFTKTIRESASSVKVLFNHGGDFHIGDKILGTVTDLREDQDAAVGEVDLFDTSYNRDLLPGIDAGAYGSSFMFRVIKDEWNDEPDRSEANPDGIPERTIREVRLFEFGPVTWPANPAATTGTRTMGARTVGVCGLTDQYYQRMRDRDPNRVDALLDRARHLHSFRTPAPGAALPPDREPAAGHSGLTPGARRRRLYPFLTAQKGTRT